MDNSGKVEIPRVYMRGTHLNCTVKVSVDGNKYKTGDVNDISSGGMNLLTEDEYNLGDKLFFELIIAGFMSEFTVFAEGRIVHIKKLPSYYSYGIKFAGLSEDDKIRIDENILKDRLVESKTYIREQQ